MPVIVRLDKIMAERKISSNELAERIGTTPVNLSRIKKGHIRGIRFNTLEQLCLALRCQPGDLLEVMSEEDARALIVSGFADNVSKELPLEYAVEMNNLIRLEMKGSIG